MTARFASNFATLLLGAGVVVATFAFIPARVSWIALGAGPAAVLVALWAFALRRQGTFQRLLDVIGAAIAAWMIVASRCYSPADARWQVFGCAAALAGLGALGLVVREYRLSTVIHENAGQNGRVARAAVPGETVPAP